MTAPKKAGVFDVGINILESILGGAGCRGEEVEAGIKAAIAVLKAAGDIPYGFVENICDEPEGAQFYRLLKPIFNAIKRAMKEATHAKV